MGLSDRDYMRQDPDFDPEEPRKKKLWVIITAIILLIVFVLRYII